MRNDLSLTLLTFIVIIINFPAGLGVDGHSASLPALAQYFNVESGYVQATISIYLLGFGMASWAFGFLTESKGRLWGIKICAPLLFLGLLICIFAPTAPILLFGRFIQGVGSSGFGIMGGVLLNEATPKQHKDRLSAYFTMSYSAIPILAPVIGGYIQHYLGWQYNFGFMLLCALLVSIIVLTRLPETCQTIGKKELHLSELLTSTCQVLKNITYLRFACLNATIWIIIPMYAVIAPFVMQNTLNLTAVEYGHYTLLIGIAWLVGSTLCSRLPEHWSSHKKILPGKVILVCIPTISYLLHPVVAISANSFILPIILQTAVSGYLYPLAYAKAVSVHNKNIGLATALIGGITCILIPLISTVILFFHVTNAYDFNIFLFIMALSTLLLFPKVPGHPKYQKQPSTTT